ncbi:unnamed protein product [Linum tenue]|uniref:Uncharacterized protein n=1 Tax=Linum tenue TaxID=586396 RepID=A0AAV0H018_9ROSI|nr:unnamed protein product [Linum tenue]
MGGRSTTKFPLLQERNCGGLEELLDSPDG